MVIGVAVNLHNIKNGGPIFPDESLRNDAVTSSAGLLGVILVTSIVLSCLLLTLGYVYRDAKRRGLARKERWF